MHSKIFKNPNLVTLIATLSSKDNVYVFQAIYLFLGKYICVHTYVIYLIMWE